MDRSRRLDEISSGGRFSAVLMKFRGQAIDPFLSGKLKARVRSPSPIHSSTSSVVAEIRTGRHPIPSSSLMRSSASTTLRT